MSRSSSAAAGALRAVRALGPIDLKSVRRDSLMRWMLVMPLLVGALFRFGVPPLGAWLEIRFAVDLVASYPLLASMLVMIAPMMNAVVIGFLLLDQKDDRTLAALEVTPLTARGYLVYRLALPLVLGVVMTVAALALSGVTTLGLGGQLVAALGAGALAPAFTLFLAAFARNKVQGFALMKAAGVVNWPPVIAWFVDPPWQWLFGLCPTYWPAKLVWELEAGGGLVWPVFAGCVGCGLLLAAPMLRRFDRAMHQ